MRQTLKTLYHLTEFTQFIWRLIIRSRYNRHFLDSSSANDERREIAGYDVACA